MMTGRFCDHCGRRMRTPRLWTARLCIEGRRRRVAHLCARCDREINVFVRDFLTEHSRDMKRLLITRQRSSE